MAFDDGSGAPSARRWCGAAGLMQLCCLMSMLPLSSGVLPQPLPLDFQTVGNIDSRQDIELPANLRIPDGEELMLPIAVPLETIRVDGKAAPKVVGVSSAHADGRWGVGEVVDVDVRFSSPVAVHQGRPGAAHGGMPTLALLTGCVDEGSCMVKEVQRAFCRADSGEFSITFDDTATHVSEHAQTAHNIPWDADPERLKFELESLSKINEVSVRYSSGRSACSSTGITIYITLDSVNIDGADGDHIIITATVTHHPD